MSQIASIALPSFGTASDLPNIPLAEYENRLLLVQERMEQDGYDFLLVYADREHSANMAYLTGFDPRFEEALLLLDLDGRRRLLVGNECLGYLPDPDLKCEAVLFQEFSLLGQDRSSSLSLRSILEDFGIGKGKQVGCVGWKYFTGSLLDDVAHAIEIPAYIVDLVRDLCADQRAVRNATSIFMNPADGLRITNSVDQIAQFEFAATRTSEGVLAVLRHIEIGAVEYELEAHLMGDGLPLSCHRMVSFGEKAKRGLASPSANRAQLGDAFTIGFGLWGALNCRAGIVGAGKEDLNGDLEGFYSRFVANYYDVVVAWYEAVKVGVRGGEVWEKVEAIRNPELYEFAVNPGHNIHYDEWVHSPFEKGGPLPLLSGMALQMDIIPVSAGSFCYSNAEEGVVIADESLRLELANRYPECWQRIEARRGFMQNSLGIRLDESVLPLSNMPGWLPPYALDLGRAMVKA